MTDLISVREVGPDDVSVGDVVWCGGWRTVSKVIARGESHQDSLPRYVFEDSAQSVSPFRGFLSEDTMLVRDTEQEHKQ